MMSTYSPVARRMPGLHRGAVALVVRVADDDRARGRGVRAGVVRRSVVDDDDLVPRAGRGERRRRPRR